ncbi:hypothetical protein [uncultured Microbacterium sp.]|uniref:hypothetical protein n=1 Tax=uncultured Microbacterium sp. TaxID=191216 RepID=UPI002628807A|nr:hypothetical protein [uncultured Microbacterium sp.]
MPVDVPDSEEYEESEIEQATAWLEKLTRDPLADAVRGVATIVTIVDPSGRGRYREYRVGLSVEGPGIPPTALEQLLVFDSRMPPQPGMRLPARVSVSDPQAVEVVWDALAR